MKLYYAPAACSLADHIALIESGLEFETEPVDLGAKRTATGADYMEINPKGYVPALALDGGELLTENIAVLGYIAERSGTLGAADGLPYWRLIEMLAYISTELHKGYKPFFKPGSSDEEKQAARETLGQRYAYLETRLGDRPFILGDTLTIADCYLFVMLMWADRKAGVPIPAKLGAYYRRLGARPGVRQALADEGIA